MNEFLRMVLQLLQEGAGLAGGAVLLCGAAAVGWLVLRRRKSGVRPGKHLLPGLALLGWGVVVLYATLLRAQESGLLRANWHLFRAWREAWNACTVKAWLNPLLNVAMFLPLGLLLPWLGRRFRRWYWTVGAGFGVSLCIELLQKLTGRGVLDVDDLFANTLGCLLGYCAGMTLSCCLAEAGKAPPKAVLRRCLPYLVCPLACAGVLAGLFVSYQLQEYGNLAEAPAFRADVAQVEWTLACDLDGGEKTAAVYRVECLDRPAAEAFAGAFAARTGAVFEEVLYYDDSVWYGNHSTGTFLTVNYRGGTYRYTAAVDAWKLAGVQMDEAALRELLGESGIALPESAVYAYEGDGEHTFTVSLAADGGVVTDGELRCLCVEGGRLATVENELLTLTPYREEPVLTRQQAYERLCAGEFSGGAWVEADDPARITVERCTLEYRIDSKGFYRPVYVFEVELDGARQGQVLVPAMA